MSSRPRRSAAQRATVAITDMADDRETTMSSRSRRSGASLSRAGSSPSADSQHMHLTVKVPASKLRQATTGSRNNQISVNSRGRFAGGELSGQKRRPTRGAKRRYVESESEDDDDDEEEEEEEQDEIRVGEGDDDDDEEDDDEEEEEEEADEEIGDFGEEDAEGEEVDDEMDVDAEGEDEDLGDDDAEGDIDMDATPLSAPAIKISKPSRVSSTSVKPKLSLNARASSKLAATQKAIDLRDDDDEELSELDSDVEDEVNDTVEVGLQNGEGDDAEGELEEEDVDVDAEGEDVDVGEDDEDDVEIDSGDESGSRAGTPDLSKMTRRQRARFEETPQEYMKLSDEVQVKKVFTAEELSMRRQEMARRRRNLSEKRNEEVKNETINKLLKRQAPKTNRRNLQGGGDETPDVEAQRADPMFIRWVNTKEGSQIAIPDEMLDGPAGKLFNAGAPRGFSRRRVVEEVS